MEEELLKKLKELESKKCKMLNCPVVINNIKSNEEIIKLKQENREQQKEIEKYRKDYIPKSKIKEKIMDVYKNYSNIDYDVTALIDLLEELLENSK